MTVTNIAWGQAGVYDAHDDRQVITALARLQAGVVKPPALTPGTGLVLNISPWLAVVPAGDETMCVCYSHNATAITVPAGPPTGTRTDVVWIDVDADTATWVMGLRTTSEIVGRAGLEVGRLVAPAGASSVAAMTLTQIQESFHPTWNQPFRRYDNAAQRDQLWPNPLPGAISLIGPPGAPADLAVRLADSAGELWRPIPVTTYRGTNPMHVGVFDPSAAVSEWLGHIEPVANASGQFNFGVLSTMGFLPRAILAAWSHPSARVTGSSMDRHSYMINSNSTISSLLMQGRYSNGTVIANGNVVVTMMHVHYQR
jgi:hypothetical protein